MSRRNVAIGAVFLAAGVVSSQCSTHGGEGVAGPETLGCGESGGVVLRTDRPEHTFLLDVTLPASPRTAYGYVAVKASRTGNAITLDRGPVALRTKDAKEGLSSPARAAHRVVTLAENQRTFNASVGMGPVDASGITNIQAMVSGPDTAASVVITPVCAPQAQ